MHVYTLISTHLHHERTYDRTVSLSHTVICLFPVSCTIGYIWLRCACALFLSAYNRKYVLGLCVYHHYSPKLPSIPFICLFILLFSHLATHSICVLAINLSKADFFRIRIAQITLSRCTHTHKHERCVLICFESVVIAIILIPFGWAVFHCTTRPNAKLDELLSMGMPIEIGADESVTTQNGRKTKLEKEREKNDQVSISHTLNTIQKQRDQLQKNLFSFICILFCVCSEFQLSNIRLLVRWHAGNMFDYIRRGQIPQIHSIDWLQNIHS